MLCIEPLYQRLQGTAAIRRGVQKSNFEHIKHWEEDPEKVIILAPTH